jgi:hypothetical protein
MRKVRHIISPVGGYEHSFCGMAFDAYASGDAETDDEFVDARPGVRVTCPDCCEAIRNIRESIKGVVLAS